MLGRGGSAAQDAASPPVNGKLEPEAKDPRGWTLSVTTEQNARGCPGHWRTCPGRFAAALPTKFSMPPGLSRASTAGV